ncbi:MAG: endonuclease/exonuclease/phosphatase family protein [Gemmobacter sp.]|uniref:endonuclease/exonuclease/phosphatase family protein n=1 Tax=Gemmobacter sp. TaxID=1898957 RepID=UPI001A3EED7F|nr:endonuclease/exonuclease/phosphatase family protein [Gemmobacter sp.]MBL8561040.1 endonuclease/exonuclease/phosphatase family protein [Gemmobacter sp.]
MTGLLWLALSGAASAETLRLATWNVDLARQGPGLLVEDLLGARPDPQVQAVIAGIVALDADVLLLTGIDHDARQVALTALADRLAAAGAPYPFRFTAPPNAGHPTGLDLDRNGKLGQPRDAMGYGAFRGQGGMALLSRLPLGPATDYTGFLWADLPGHLMPADTPAPERAGQRLSSVNHWQVPVQLPGGGQLAVLAFAATPPVFDGPEDRNGRRNHDEAAFWLRLMEGALPFPAPRPPLVLMGDANLDSADGDGRPQALRALLSGPALQDPAPRGSHGRSEAAHQGDPALDTAFYAKGVGGLRVDYVLPSAGLRVSGAGVLWPADGALAETLAQASRHRPVWVDVTLP